ncbi:CREBBP [Cordylochernes scorpioides]|uniref:adenylate cyclase n=1 Tax=Cordylochernes scorpioides TaxID=51811 RepID=A0ABY6K9E5_9ARAC|nr:CREBBP [Cordylochernes scorpioides]
MCVCWTGMRTYFILGSKQGCPAPSTQLPEEDEEEEEEESAKAMLPMHTRSSLSTLNSSRKDSGIRSRGSSLQDAILDSSAILATNLLSHRFSGGYYTSSQTSLADTGRGSSGSSTVQGSILVDHNSTLNEHLVRLRHMKQSDLQMIRSIQQDPTHPDYLVRPPINPFSLNFQDSSLESRYRKKFQLTEPQEGTPTLSSFNTYFDILLSSLFYVVVAGACFALFTPPVPVWLVVSVPAILEHVFILVLYGHFLLHCSSPRLSKIFTVLTRWRPWHLYVSFMALLPALAILVNNLQCHAGDPLKAAGSNLLMTACLLHFVNYTQVNHWLRTGLCIAVGTAYLLELFLCPPCLASFCPREEALLNIILQVLLVWLLSREFEISHRLGFHGSVTAARDRRRIQAMKNQADWLLHNLLPKHVAEHLKTSSKYSENHKDAGIIFASIVNFNEMYDESYEGGKEYLRVLNELVGDFDELLLNPEFRNVEKIKTIGSTFMAASGINTQLRKENPHPHHHLVELMNFAIAMQHVIERFNSNLLEFSFILRIGYNFGDVTAGVIGTTKLYYDIWGDAVNIASRMDSTGVSDRIQVPEHCVPVLSRWFDFEYRGSIFVKGKDNMDVFLLKGRKERPHSIAEAPELTLEENDIDD